MQSHRTSHGDRAPRPLARIIGAAIGLVVVPALFFVLLEGGLRLGGYGVNTDLVLDDDGGTCHLNADVAQRYFSPPLRSIQPSIGFRVFDRAKTPGALRVFVLGESTTAGFPFHVNGSFAGFLEDELRAAYPARDIEVINCGMSAISSYVVLDFARQLVDYQPDLFLVYTGHNEFYGALGAASARAARPSRALTLLEMKLANLRTYQLVCNTIFRLRPGPARGTSGQSLMAAMIGNEEVRPDSRLHREAEASFRANLSGIIEVAQQHHVPVIVATVTSNLRDFPPFDGQDAAAHYRRAQALAADSTQTDAARLEYIRARDLDTVHFRACSRFNDIIREVTTAHHAPLLDMDAVFASHTPRRVPGTNLFLEHLHPNLRGAMLMADAFLDVMQSEGIVPRNSAPERSFEQALRDACITPLDLELARQRIVSMTSQPPFARAFGDHGEFPKATRDVEQMARRILERDIDLAAAHEAMGREYLAAKDLVAALAEFRALAKIYPLSPSGPINTADILLQMRRPADAIPWYRTGLALDPGSVQTRLHLAMAYNAAGDTRDALAECNRILAIDPNNTQTRRLVQRLRASNG
ncbi:MAG TPA: tetratricopeptide repeat protein [Candidatus Krumholzibacteria bacterium]